MAERYEIAKNRISEIEENKRGLCAKQESILEFIKILRKSDSLLTEFDEGLWNSTIETVTVLIAFTCIQKDFAK